MNRFVAEVGRDPDPGLAGRHERGRAEHRRVLRRRAWPSGAAALNIIPDRNYTPGVKDQKLKNLYDVVALAEQHHFPIIVGTEMNCAGQQVRGFLRHGGTEAAGAGVPAGRAYRLRAFGSAAPERAGLSEPVGEARLSRRVAAKNDFFERLGARLQPATEETLARLDRRGYAGADSSKILKLRGYAMNEHSTDSSGPCNWSAPTS